MPSVPQKLRVLIILVDHWKRSGREHKATIHAEARRQVEFFVNSNYRDFGFSSLPSIKFDGTLLKVHIKAKDSHENSWITL